MCHSDKEAQRLLEKWKHDYTPEKKPTIPKPSNAPDARFDRACLFTQGQRIRTSRTLSTWTKRILVKRGLPLKLSSLQVAKIKTSWQSPKEPFHAVLEALALLGGEAHRDAISLLVTRHIRPERAYRPYLRCSKRQDKQADTRGSKRQADTRSLQDKLRMGVRYYVDDMINTQLHFGHNGEG